MLRKPETNAGLRGPLARMQRLYLYFFYSQIVGISRRKVVNSFPGLPKTALTILNQCFFSNFNFVVNLFAKISYNLPNPMGSL